MNSPKDRLRKIASEKKSDWMERAEWRINNELWLDYSAKIAVRILQALNGSSQKTLAEKLNVSPQYVSSILKGKENLTLETISKIEQALNISLLEIPGFKVTVDLKLLENIKAVSFFSAGSTTIDPEGYTYCDPKKEIRLVA